MQDAIAILAVLLGPIGGLSPCIAAEAQDPNHQSSIINHQSPGIIRSIEFEGNRRYKSHVLRERLGFQLGDRLDPFLAEGGRTTIMELYRKVGYPSVQVSLDRQRLAEGHLLYRIKEGPHVQVGRIDFVGNESFRSRTLRQVIKTKRHKWWVRPASFTEETVEEDADRLRTFYYAKGYLNHKIEPRMELTADGRKVNITFVIEEGPVYHVAGIVFTGVTRFPVEQLRERIKLREGDVYRKPRVERDVRELAHLYRERGFVDAEVRHGVTFTPQVQDHLVVVTFDIREGRQFRIGRLDITGNEMTKDRAIRQILDEYGFTPGELYDAKRAPKEGGGQLERYLERHLMAEEAMIRPLPPAAEDPNRRDVRVDLKEGMTGTVQPGIGFSSDHGVIGQLIFEQRNFDITDWPDSLHEALFPWTAFRGDGQRLSMRLMPGTRYSSYSVDFADPYWLDEPITLDVLGRKWDWRRESHDENRLKGAVEFEQRLENQWRRSIGFRAENVDIDDLDFDAPQEIRDVQGRNQLFGMRFGLGKSALDDLYDPSAGWRASVFYEQVTGDDTFGILEGSLARYFTVYEDVLGRKTILAGRVLAGTILGDAPPFEKFYAGGARHYGIRGFEYRGVSPRGLQAGPDIDPALAQKKDPIGSDWVFLAGTELTVPLPGENFNALFFLDSGTVETGHYRLSIGFGIEIKVPQVFRDMPLRFELAFPLLEDEEDENQVFSFSGGSFGWF